MDSNVRLTLIDRLALALQTNVVLIDVRLERCNVICVVASNVQPTRLSSAPFKGCR